MTRLELEDLPQLDGDGRMRPSLHERLRFLRGADQDFTYKRLRGLGYQHGDGVGDVLGAEHFAVVATGVGAEFGFG